MIHVKWPNSERIILILLVATIALGRSSWDCGFVKASASTDNCNTDPQKQLLGFQGVLCSGARNLQLTSQFFFLQLLENGRNFHLPFFFFDGVVCITVFVCFSVSGPSQKGSISEVQESRWNKEGKSASREVLQSGPPGWCVLYHPARRCWLNASTA